MVVLFMILETVVPGHILVTLLAVQQLLVLLMCMLGGQLLAGEEQIAVAGTLECQIAVLAVHFHVRLQPLLDQIDFAAYLALEDLFVQLAVPIHILKDILNLLLVE